MPPIIEVKHLTKEYRLGSLTSIKDTFRQGLATLMGKKDLAWEREWFKALDDVSFSIEKGEVVGIIGHNGAGKSTLLKHLANITTPTHGEVHVRGTVAPLIEVGAGLNPELTGRENIYLNGAILGIPKNEIEKKLDGIIDFSELEQFIDTPVKRYSSGMTVKLGFSIATSIDADILIVDEVLAVGDLAFQRKCFDKMEELIKEKGRTVLVVSHNIRQIERLSNRVIMLEQGKILKDGMPQDVCEEYYLRSNEKIARQAADRSSKGRNIIESGEVALKSIKLIDGEGRESEKFECGSPMTIRCEFESQVELSGVEYMYGYHTTDMVYIATMGTAHLPSEESFIKVGLNVIDCTVRGVPLVPGVYAIRIGVLNSVRRQIFYGETLQIFTVLPNNVPTSKMSALGLVYIPAEWGFKALE